jgi:hypothetical protein
MTAILTSLYVSLIILVGAFLFAAVERLKQIVASPSS